MWGRFWDSFGAIEENGSQISDTSSQVISHISHPISPHPSTSLSQLRTYSDISPNESASMVNNDTTSTAIGSILDDPNSFSFKFTTPGQKTHRVVCKPVFNELLEAIRVKMIPEHGDDVGDEEWLSISYLDDEEDNVLMSCDADVADAIHLARKEGQTRVKLLVQDQKTIISTPNLATISQSDNEAETPIIPKSVIEEPSSPIIASTKAKKISKKSSTQQQAKNDLLLPAAIGFLGVVIAGVFVYSRVQQKSN